jgi:hypothetical protein
LKRCITEDNISNEYARRKEILQSIDNRKFSIWQYKKYILREKVKINHLCLKLFSQFTSYSKKDKLASVSYNYNINSITYKTYKQVKMTIAENTMLSAPSFKLACILSAKQEMVSPIFHYVFNQKSETLNGPTPLPLSQNPVVLMGRLNYSM